ncbi:hypothetical protein N9A68_05615 [Cyclobacteriaceae bacterium]|nr:hypothetical protein [Cyclobacteriaceae bacterium]
METLKPINPEILHYTSNNLKIYSKSCSIYIETLQALTRIKLPKSIYDLFSFSRILRRLLRIDKCNVFLIKVNPIELIIIRRGIVYKYQIISGLIKTLELKNCRNILHVDLCRLPNGDLVFGEYGSNNDRKSVPIYLSKDSGLSWDIIYEFPENSIKHIHVIKYDKWLDTIWCCTGDNDGENKIVIFDKFFSILEEIGDGSQYYRTCDLFFTKTNVVWLMDSPNVISHVVNYNRKTKKINIGQELAGPVWYTTKVEDNLYLAATSVEPGYSMKHKTAQLMASKDLINWEIVKSYKKDCYPIDLFKYGVIAFPLGDLYLSSFFYFGEALIKLDGKIDKINLTNVFR